ncbi:MAG: hypothetical protein ACK4IK_08835 [Bacteroidia bacterium]
MTKKINWANDYTISESLKEIGTSAIAICIRIMSNLDEGKYKELIEKLDKESDEIHDYINSNLFFATKEEAEAAVDKLAAKHRELDLLEDAILNGKYNSN